MPNAWPSSSMTRTSRTLVSRGPRSICSFTRKSLLIDAPPTKTYRRYAYTIPTQNPDRQTVLSVPDFSTCVNGYLTMSPSQFKLIHFPYQHFSSLTPNWLTHRRETRPEIPTCVQCVKSFIVFVGWDMQKAGTSRSE